MSKKKCVVIIIIILILVGSCAAYSIKQKTKTTKEDNDPNVSYFERSENIDHIEWMGVAEDGVSTCIVQYDYFNAAEIVPGDCVICTSEKGSVTKISYDVNKSFEYERFEIYAYDIETREKRFLFDVVEFLEDYPGMQIPDPIRGWSDCVIINGQPVYQRAFEPCPQIDIPYEQVDCDYLCINVEDGSYTIQENRTSWLPQYPVDIYYDLEDRKLLRNNLPEGMMEILDDEIGGGYAWPYTNYEGVFEVYGIAEYLPQNNEVLYGMFPELKQYRGEENCFIYMLIGGDPTAEELLRLFMEDGQEISFEGAVLSGERSIDGEPHEIHSFEEYEQWRMDE